MALVKRYKEHRENITCSVFLNAWKEMFDCDKYNVSKESYKSLHDKHQDDDAPEPKCSSTHSKQCFSN